MGRRGCDSEIIQNPEPPKKRNRTASDNHVMNASINIEQPLPPGVVLTDVSQKEWRIGKPIGCGSFGQIYLASDDIYSDVTPDTARYVLKVEPHSNGPLFVELHCLIRTARHHKIKSWQEEKQLKSLGMPHFIANGSHVLGDTRYRFLVLPRYDIDLQKLSRTMNFGRIHPRNVLILAAQIIDVLEYLHAKGYTHSDIKSSNLMVGFDGSKFRDQRICRYMLPPTSPANCSSNSEASSKKSQSSHQQKNKSRQSTYSGYYEDEDFDLNNYSASSSDAESDEDGNIKKNNRTRMTSKKSRAKKIFNLRKQKLSVNYGGDENSSICSDGSYLRSVNGNVREKSELYSSDEGFHEEIRSKRSSESHDDETEVDYFEESILTQSSGQVYVLDYGLASKFVNSEGTHKEFGMDQRKAHDGTLEYSSRDSHIGAHSRRSDLENLGFNILDWLTGSLPWKTSKIMDNPDLVHAVKKNYMNDLKQLLETCFKTPNYPAFVEKFFQYITKLEFTDKPDYAYCKSLFINEFVSCRFGTEKDMVLNFSSDVNVFPQKKKNYSKKIGRNTKTLKNTSPEFLKRNGVTKPSGRENFILNSWENNLKMDLLREGLNHSNDGNRKPCTSRNFYVSDSVLITKLRQSLLPILETPSKKFSPKNLRSKKIVNKKRRGVKNKRSSIGKFGNFLGSGKQYTWAEILAGNPEDIIRKVDTANETKNPRSRKVSNASEVSLPNDVNASPNLLRKDFLANRNPTYAMKQVVAQYKRKISGKPLSKSENEEFDNQQSGSCYTYAMVMVLRNKEKRLKREKVSEENIYRKKVNVKECRSKNVANSKSASNRSSTNQNDSLNISKKSLNSCRNDTSEKDEVMNSRCKRKVLVKEGISKRHLGNARVTTAGRNKRSSVKNIVCEEKNFSDKEKNEAKLRRAFVVLARTGDSKSVSNISTRGVSPRVTKRSGAVITEKSVSTPSKKTETDKFKKTSVKRTKSSSSPKVVAVRTKKAETSPSKSSSSKSVNMTETKTKQKKTRLATRVIATRSKMLVRRL